MATVVNVGVFVFVAVMFVGGYCATISENYLLWKQHKALTDSFLCKPRPRSFRAVDLFKELQDDDVLPWETVLYVCDGQSGCCKGNNLECLPKTEERVQLAFFSLIKQNISIYEATNHTSCSCQHGNSDYHNSIKKR